MDVQDRTAILAFVIALSVSMFVFLRAGTTGEGVDRDIHDQVVRTIQEEGKAFKLEAGIIITSMASAIGILYLNGRKDLKESRRIFDRMALALERLPCQPDLYTRQAKTGGGD
jgi:hypothetical protein